MPDSRTRLTRREALKGSVTLLGSTFAATQLGTIMSRAAAAAEAGDPPAFFDETAFELLGSIADTMIPDTDTPGARAVGVHYFVDTMLDEWASPARQARYVLGLQNIGDALREAGGDDFTQLSSEEQLEALREIDTAAFADDSGDPFYPELKRMLLFGYYSSAAGATEELNYEPLPGEYRPCIEVDDDVRAWFHVGFRHGL